MEGRMKNEEVRRVAAEGEMSNEKGERLRLRLRLRGWREQEKCQITHYGHGGRRVERGWRKEDVGKKMEVGG
jgi:hypothetical protein